jgi:hypothetical protein
MGRTLWWAQQQAAYVCCCSCGLLLGCSFKLGVIAGIAVAAWRGPAWEVATQGAAISEV